ncbi:L-threonylcarbamoyladenylate synthase [Paenibacillus castaneae]|uniref:L-threonylcarbamoyladenylate synthase n=1 Tax=Paenibacillus castaneae TaxID=474957 RepID=UPI000C99E727|nr:L-threonylcarbamoyladenylate synthase [Paenibacillus castaneae]NIK79430.1 L-threonylcarbamoyladenylate synthase [Paenibacillus castaneae]
MTKTNIWRVEQAGDDQLPSELKEAASQLREGGLIAFPTETVYGLGADARSTAAVERIFMAKGRPSDNPLIVHIAQRSQLDELVLPYPELAAALMDRFWPGPLTIVLPLRGEVLSPLVTAGLSTVGIRMPNHRSALELLMQAGCPVAAPSANRSGRPSPTLAEHVLEDLNGRIDGVVDDGATGVGLESTVIELEGEKIIRILRPGGITKEALQQAAPHALVDSASTEEESNAAPRSPGMKYTHYAPKGELELVNGAPEAVVAYIASQAMEAQQRGEITGVLAFEERLSAYEANRVISLGSELELGSAAHLLYAALRELDEAGVQRIWAEGCTEQGIGAALMNRMAKAAGNRIIHV